MVSAEVFPQNLHLKQYTIFMEISNKKFGLQLGLLLTFISLFDLILIRSNFRFITLFIGLSLIICALIAQSLLTPIKFIWLKISIVLAQIFNPMILATLFIFIFIPVGFILKISKRDLLLLNSNNATTFKNVLSKEKINFERQF